MTMRISAEGIQLIKDFEGLRLEAYIDVAGVATIGYGHTASVRRSDAVHKPRKRITEQEAEDLLRMDLEWAEACVRKHVRKPLKQNHYDALVSFTYNLGCTALRKSSVLKHVHRGDDFKASESFMLWVKAWSPKQQRLVTLNGLVRRRKAERILFERFPLPPVSDLPENS